jgi:cytochrome c551/c552
MKKYLIAAIIIMGILILGLQSSDIRAENSNTIFESLRCGTCHKPNTGKAFPSLKEIVKAYDGNEGRLISYLQGETGPIVKKEKVELMKRYIEKTKALSREDIKSLVDYILNFKDI